MTDNDSSKPRSSGEAWGDRIGRTIGDAATQIEQETERLIKYLNDEVVPGARQQSSEALRKAADKLAEFANYLDNRREKKGP